MQSLFRCSLCGPSSVREGVYLEHLECGDGEGFSRHEVLKYVECLKVSCKRKLSTICLERWRTAYLAFKEKELKPEEEILDDEGVWATLDRAPWRQGTKRKRGDLNFQPSIGEKAAKFKRACVACEESIGERRVRRIEPAFKEAKPDLEVNLLPPITAEWRCNDDGTDGLPIDCQFDVVGMWPMVAEEACAEYFKGAHDQPLTTPGECLLASLCTRLRARPARAGTYPQLSYLTTLFRPLPEPHLFHSVPAQRGDGCELTARLFQVW
jgi:hypothetical protein